MFNDRKLFFIFCVGLTILSHLGYASEDSENHNKDGKRQRIKEGLGVDQENSAVFDVET
jgi:hypothetical protein